MPELKMFDPSQFSCLTQGAIFKALNRYNKMFDPTQFSCLTQDAIFKAVQKFKDAYDNCGGYIP